MSSEINNNNNTPVVTNGSLTKAEDYINKLDKIDKIFKNK